MKFPETVTVPWKSHNAALQLFLELPGRYLNLRYDLNVGLSWIPLLGYGALVVIINGYLELQSRGVRSLSITCVCDSDRYFSGHGWGRRHSAATNVFRLIKCLLILYCIVVCMVLCYLIKRCFQHVCKAEGFGICHFSFYLWSTFSRKQQQKPWVQNVRLSTQRMNTEIVELTWLINLFF